MPAEFTRHLLLPKTKAALCGERGFHPMSDGTHEVRWVNCLKCLDRLAEMHPNKEVDRDRRRLVPREEAP